MKNEKAFFCLGLPAFAKSLDKNSLLAINKIFFSYLKQLLIKIFTLLIVSINSCFGVV